MLLRGQHDLVSNVIKGSCYWELVSRWTGLKRRLLRPLQFASTAYIQRTTSGSADWNSMGLHPHGLQICKESSVLYDRRRLRPWWIDPWIRNWQMGHRIPCPRQCRMLSDMYLNLSLQRTLEPNFKIRPDSTFQLLPRIRGSWRA